MDSGLGKEHVLLKSRPGVSVSVPRGTGRGGVNGCEGEFGATPPAANYREGGAGRGGGMETEGDTGMERDNGDAPMHTTNLCMGGVIPDGFKYWRIVRNAKGGEGGRAKSAEGVPRSSVTHVRFGQHKDVSRVGVRAEEGRGGMGGKAADVKDQYINRR